MQRDPRAYLSDILEAAAAIQDATRTIGEALCDRLQRRVAEDGHSMEGEVRQIRIQLINAPRAWWEELEQEGHSNPWLLGKQTDADEGRHP